PSQSARRSTADLRATAFLVIAYLIWPDGCVELPTGLQLSIQDCYSTTGTLATAPLACPNCLLTQPLPWADSTSHQARSLLWPIIVRFVPALTLYTTEKPEPGPLRTFNVPVSTRKVAMVSAPAAVLLVSATLPK